MDLRAAGFHLAQLSLLPFVKKELASGRELTLSLSLLKTNFKIDILEKTVHMNRHNFSTLHCFSYLRFCDHDLRLPCLPVISI